MHARRGASGGAAGAHGGGGSQRVKGSMKMSFNDRWLIKNLYFADQHSRYAKIRSQRNLVRVEREAARVAPRQRGAAAFLHYAKRVERGVPRVFEMRDADDTLAVPAMLRAEWHDVARRHQRLRASARVYVECANAMAKQRKAPPSGGSNNGDAAGADDKTRRAAAALARRVSALARAGADTRHMPWLVAKRNARVDNYHERAQRWAGAVGDVDPCTQPRTPLDRALQQQQQRTQNASTDAAATSVPRAAAAPSTHECERHASLAYTCYVCRRAVHSADDMALLSWVPATRAESHAQLVDEYPSGSAAMALRPAQARVAHVACARRLRAGGGGGGDGARDGGGAHRLDAKRIDTDFALYDDDDVVQDDDAAAHSTAV